MLFHGQAEEGDKPLRGRIPRSGIQIVVDPPDSYTGPGVAVQNGGADPKFGVAGAEGACHEALPRQLHPMHPLTGRVFPQEISRQSSSRRDFGGGIRSISSRWHGLIPNDGPRGRWRSRRGIPARRDDGLRTPVSGGSQTMSGSDQPLMTLPRNVLPVGGSSGNHIASALRCRPASSWSCNSAGWVCSCRTAATLASGHESLTQPLRIKADGDAQFVRHCQCAAPMENSRCGVARA